MSAAKLVDEGHKALIARLKKKKEAERYLKEAVDRYRLDRNVSAFSAVLDNLIEAGWDLQLGGWRLV